MASTTNSKSKKTASKKQETVKNESLKAKTTPETLVKAESVSSKESKTNHKAESHAKEAHKAEAKPDVKTTHRNEKKSSKLFKKPAALAALIGAIVVVLLLAGYLYVTTSAQYAYWDLYNKANERNVDAVMELVDSKQIAENITSDQEVFFSGQQVDSNQIKYNLKGQVEYTIDKMARDGELEQILTFKPANFVQSFQENPYKVEDGKMIVEFGKPNKENAIDGIGGYKTGILERRDGQWKLVEIRNNPAVEEEKRKLQANNQQPTQ